MTEQQAMTMAKDPVRGMDVDPTTTKHRDDFQGQDDSCRRLMSRRGKLGGSAKPPCRA